MRVCLCLKRQGPKLDIRKRIKFIPMYMHTRANSENQWQGEGSSTWLNIMTFKEAKRRNRELVVPNRFEAARKGTLSHRRIGLLVLTISYFHVTWTYRYNLAVAVCVCFVHSRFSNGYVDATHMRESRREPEGGFFPMITRARSAIAM